MICEKVVFYDLFPTNIDVQANEKNIRISALDEGEVCFKAFPNFQIGQNSLQVKIFLIACSIKEAEKLYTALEYRSDIVFSDLVHKLLICVLQTITMVEVRDWQLLELDV